MLAAQRFMRPPILLHGLDKIHIQIKPLLICWIIKKSLYLSVVLLRNYIIQPILVIYKKNNNIYLHRNKIHIPHSCLIL